MSEIKHHTDGERRFSIGNPCPGLRNFPLQCLTSNFTWWETTGWIIQWINHGSSAIMLSMMWKMRTLHYLHFPIVPHPSLRIPLQDGNCRYLFGESWLINHLWVWQRLQGGGQRNTSVSFTFRGLWCSFLSHHWFGERTCRLPPGFTDSSPQFVPHVLNSKIP